MKLSGEFLKLLLISVSLNVTANILLKTGVKTIGGLGGQSSRLFNDLLKAVISPYIILGLVLYGLSFIIWLRILSFNDLSRAYPIFATVVFTMTTIGSVLFLKEDVSFMRIIGLLVMLAGIYIVSRS